MVIALILIFYALCAGFGLARGFTTRSLRENLFISACLLLSFAVLFMQGMELELPDPLTPLARLAEKIMQE